MYYYIVREGNLGEKDNLLRSHPIPHTDSTEDDER